MEGVTFFPRDFKARERESRGRSDKVLIKSTMSIVPTDFSALLRNVQNKFRLAHRSIWWNNIQLSGQGACHLTNIRHLFS